MKPRKYEKRWKAWHLNFHSILFIIKAQFETCYTSLVYWIGQATFSQQTVRTYKLDTFRNPIQKQLTDLNIKSFSFIMIDEIPWNKNVWAKTIMLVTGFKNWDKKKRQKKKHLYVFFANMRKLLCKVRIFKKRTEKLGNFSSKLKKNYDTIGPNKRTLNTYQSSLEMIHYEGLIL